MNVFSTERLEEFFLPLERRVKPFFIGLDFWELCRKEAKKEDVKL